MVPDRAALDAALAEMTERFPDGEPVPAPPFWGGFRLVPESVEFWQGRTGRMHDRLRFVRDPAAPAGPADAPPSTWHVQRLAP